MGSEIDGPSLELLRPHHLGDLVAGAQAHRQHDLLVVEQREGALRVGMHKLHQRLVVGVWMMRRGEEKVVAKRLREVLENRS